MGIGLELRQPSFSPHVVNVEKDSLGPMDRVLLFMLSTGEDKDLEVARRWVRKAVEDSHAREECFTYPWFSGYGGTGVAKYHLRTGDEEVLSVLQKQKSGGSTIPSISLSRPTDSALGITLGGRPHGSCFAGSRGAVRDRHGAAGEDFPDRASTGT